MNRNGKTAEHLRVAGCPLVNHWLNRYQSDAAIDHEAAAMNRGEAGSSDVPKPSPKLPVNTGDGWRKGAGTDMI